MLSAIDFTCVEVWTKRGLVTFYLLFVIELKTRRVHFAGCTVNPHDGFMKQIARELTNPHDGFLSHGQYLIMDRDTKFSESFRSFLDREDITPVRLPPRSPNLNAHLERFMRSIKDECFSRMIFFGEKSLRNAVNQYLEHYHLERNHQGLGNQIIEPQESTTEAEMTLPIQRRERLGGMLNHYHRAAA